MKFFKTFIIIITLSCLTIAIPNDNNGKTELNDFLLQIQRRTKVAARIVKIDEEFKSMKIFFESSPSLGKKDNDIWQVTDEGVNRAGNLIHSVMSCEYSESTYYLAQTLLTAINAFYKNNIVDNRLSIQNSLLEPLKDVLSHMILTLVGLLKYTKHYSQKNQEFLNTLLSWYVTIMHSEHVEYDKDGKNPIHHIDGTLVVLYQVEKYLKIFILNNCQNLDDFTKCKNLMDEEFSKQNDDIDRFKDLISIKYEALKPLLYKKFLDKTYGAGKLFVLPTSDTHSTNIRDFISQQASSSTLIIKWDSKTTGELSTIYNDYISKNANGIYSLLKFERILLQNITKIIMGYVSNELKIILSDPQLSESRLISELQGKLISTLDTYIQKFHDDGQPIFLINNMTTIKNDLLIVSSNKKLFEDKKIEMGKYISKLNESKIDIPLGEGLSKLRRFLITLSENVICAKLHPVVSNVYWGKLYFSPTKISNYVIDLKYLQIKYENLPRRSYSMCKTLSYISGKLKGIVSSISDCEKNVSSNDSQTIATCLNNLGSKYAKLKTVIDEIVSSINGNFNFNWKKLLLSVVCNINNVESYGNRKKDIMKIMKDLNILQNSISEYFNIGFELTCKSMPAWVEGFSREPTSLSQAEYRGMNRNLVDIVAYQDFFKTIDELIGKIIASNIDPEITLYWDGIGMTLKEVYEMYKLYSLDQLQINYDYFKFLVRWYVAVVYSNIIEIINEIIKSNTSRLSSRGLSKVFFVDSLELIFREFLKLPLYISMPVSNVLGVFVCVLKSYDGINNEGLYDYINILEIELEKLDYMPTTKTIKKKRTFSIYIQLLIEKIRHLVHLFESDKSIIEIAVINIGVDLNDQYMMFHDWN